jgi:hypothetical protein
MTTQTGRAVIPWSQSTARDSCAGFPRGIVGRSGARLALPQACPVALCHTRRSVADAGVPRMEQLEKIVAPQQFAMH